MARTGRSGRQPRVVQSLTATILAIAREQARQQDENIMSAWKSGGFYTDANGDKQTATDSKVLAYWNRKLKDLSPDDPLADAYRNQVLQLTYAVEQSKQDLLHLQGKLSDSQYANFFLRWSKKVPKDSEFYRVLQKDAARLIEQSKARGRASANNQKIEAFNKWTNSISARDIDTGNLLTAAAEALAKQANLTITGDGERVLEMLTQDVAQNPAKYELLLASVRKSDPQWDGQITPGFFSAKITQATRGYDLVYERANREGYVDVASKAAKGESEMASWGANLKVWPVSQSLQAARLIYDRVLEDDNASQLDKRTASQDFANSVGVVAGAAGLDPATRSLLDADIARALGEDAGNSPGFSQGVLGVKGIDAQASANMAYYNQQYELMKANPGAYVYASTDKNGAYDPTGRGALGIVDFGTVPANAQMVAVPQRGGHAIMAAVVPVPMVVEDPNNPNAERKNAGWSLSYVAGGQVVNMYTLAVDPSAAKWSLSLPTSDGTTSRIDSKTGELVLTPRTQSPQERAADINARYGTSFRVNPVSGELMDDSFTVASKAPQGTQGIGTSASQKISVKNGVFSGVETTKVNSLTGSASTDREMDFTTVFFDKRMAIAPQRLTTEDIPGVTFSSTLAASLDWASGNLSGTQANALSKDPVFQNTFVRQTMAALGTEDIYDPRISKAWQVATAPKVSIGGTALDEQDAWRSGMTPQQREDLLFPGAPAGDEAYKGEVTLNFGANQLKLPGMPSYFGIGKQVDMTMVSRGMGGPGFDPNAYTQPGSAPLPTATPVVSATPSPINTADYRPPPTTVPTATAPPKPTPPPSTIGSGGFMNR